MNDGSVPESDISNNVYEFSRRARRIEESNILDCRKLKSVVALRNRVAALAKFTI